MFFAATLAIVIFSLGYMAVTLILSRRKVPLPVTGREPDLFVFVVPALNEVAVIASTLRCLLAACGDRGRVLVIDDGSDDGTADVIDALRDAQTTDTPTERLWVLTRTAPLARQGKGQALNAAFELLRTKVADMGIDTASVVLGIVDADGRIATDVLDFVAPYFRNPEVGAVQLLVRIRNRSRLLSRFQDYEFTLFSALTQTAREHVGSVGLGGNGQFTRLAALATLGNKPWTDCLTEDLDLGVRLAIAGWTNRFCGETFVDQQGLNAVSPLLRQRTRWAQGHFQCWGLIPRIVASQLPTLTVLDLCYYLIAPAISMLASILFTVPLFWGLGGLAMEPGRWLSLYGAAYFAVLYLMSFIPSMLMSVIYWRRSRDLSLVRALMLGNLLIVYNYIWYLAQWKALARLVTRRGSWAKTGRTAEDTTTADRRCHVTRDGINVKINPVCVTYQARPDHYTSPMPSEQVRTVADDPVDASLAQVARDGDEQGDCGPVEMFVDAHDDRSVSSCLDRRDVRLEFLSADLHFGRAVQTLLIGPLITKLPGHRSKPRFTMSMDETMSPSAIPTSSAAGAIVVVSLPDKGAPLVLDALKQRVPFDARAIDATGQDLRPLLYAALAAPPESLLAAAPVLTKLAILSATLHRHLVATAGKQLAEAGWIHVVQLGACNIPFEFAYAPPMPAQDDNVPLCAPASAGATACPGDCPPWAQRPGLHVHQGDRIGVIRLGPGHPVPFPILAAHHRVDRVHPAPGPPQARQQQSGHRL